MKINTDEENDIMACHFNDNLVNHSEEHKTKNGQKFVIDIDYGEKICGIEIFDFKEFKKIRNKKV